jgi:hypothetical protein
MATAAPPGQEFVFRTKPDTTVGTARTLDEFTALMEKVEPASIAFHLREDLNDFAAWIAGSLNNEPLARRTWAAKNASNAEAMRTLLLSVLKQPAQPLQRPKKRF